MTTITHKEYTEVYYNGRSEAESTFTNHGKDYAIKELNRLYPPAQPITSLSDYYRAKGMLDFLLDAK